MSEPRATFPSDADAGDDVPRGPEHGGGPVIAVALVGSAVVVALAILTIAVNSAVPRVGIVIVGDANVPVDAPLPLRVLGLGARARTPFVGVVDEVVVDGAGLVTVPRPAQALALRGTVDGVPVALDVSLPPPARPSVIVEVVPWTRALALPAQGAAVYPVGGAVAGRGATPVVLVDDDDVTVVDVDPQRSARLPDGRLVAVDRDPLLARLVQISPQAGGALDVEIHHGGDRGPVAVELLVGGVTRALLDAPGEGRVTLTVPNDAVVGEVIVVRVSESPLPSANGRVLVTFVGGPPIDVLARVEPRIARQHAAFVADETVVRALLARLAPTPSQTSVLSPSLAEQVRAREAARDADGARHRSAMRVASVFVLVLVIAFAVRAARRAPVAAVGAVLVVLVLLLALDGVVGAVLATRG